MPKGKGTYGSKVGRPPKKVKGYQAGGVVGMSNPLLPDDMQDFAVGGAVDARARSMNVPGYADGGAVKKAKESKTFSDLDKSTQERHDYMQKRSPGYKKSKIGKLREALKKKKVKKYEEGGEVKSDSPLARMRAELKKKNELRKERNKKFDQAAKTLHTKGKKKKKSAVADTTKKKKKNLFKSDLFDEVE